MTNQFHCEGCGARVSGSMAYIENVADSHLCPAPITDQPERTTTAGTRVYVPDLGTPARVFVDHPDQPTEFRHQKIGHIHSGGFSPTLHLPANHGPEVLRALADLVEEMS